MKIKVMIENGIIQTVLGDNTASQTNLEIEIVDVNSDYEDLDKMKEYAEKLYSNKELVDIPYCVTNFSCTLEQNIISCETCKNNIGIDRWTKEIKCIECQGVNTRFCNHEKL